ncbi:type IV secretory system conjugative DNA transfer family protein [Haladaptatus sp. DFWS20]|uniref:type IV secretory system conjugative DNA transfer family protein n=1 Tax=Haladaptatus sp. DFWS20 TaxID=3403467 RepID=UPI003EBAFD6B
MVLTYMATIPSISPATRTVFRIHPTTDPLATDTLSDQFRRLYSLTDSDDQTGIPNLLSRSEPTPRILECLLIATPDGSLEYSVGFPPEMESQEDNDSALTALENTLRTVFPDSYELERDTVSLATTLGLPTETDSTTELDESLSDPHVAAIEFSGTGDRRNDWQTALTPFSELTNDDNARPPLAAITETLATTTVPVVFQILLRPKPDWTTEAGLWRNKLTTGRDSLIGSLVEELFVPTETQRDTTTRTENHLPEETQRRLDGIDARDTRHSFDVNVRAVAVAEDDPFEATHAVEALATTLTAIDGADYRLTAETYPATGKRSAGALDLLDELLTAEFHDDPTGLRTRLPGGGTTSPSIVADPTEVPSFCVLDGAHLTGNAKRAFSVTPRERAALIPPSQSLLSTYEAPGFTLGTLLTQDNRSTDQRISLLPELQSLHAAIFGKTGSGKTVLLTTGMLDNHAATAGPSILVEGKGDGMPLEYLRAHYKRYGTLENVYFFDCAAVLPALSFFDIRPQLAAGIGRSAAVQNIADHYIEILIGIMGRERFERAVRSPDIITYLVKALFDPVHGADAYSHSDLHRAAKQMKETRDVPPVTDETLSDLLGGVVTTTDERAFDAVMDGVLNRIEKVPVDDRLARLFDHVPTLGAGFSDETDENPSDPRFDFFDVLDENAVVILDTSGLREASKQALTLVLLSNLWTALQRRKRLQTTQQEHTNTADPALVNLYIEEAAQVASSGLMTELLALSRGFGLSVTLAMQFPAQLRNADNEAYAEILNNVSTIVTGNVAVDRDLERRLATGDMSPSEVGNRLRALHRGQWVTSLPAPFGAPEPRPFVLESAPLPPGHPAGDDPLTETDALAFGALVDATADRTRLDSGIDMLADSAHQTQETATADKQTAEDGASADAPLTSALPFTKRLPMCLRYDAAIHGLVCTGCESRHPPTIAGLKRGIECCSSLAQIDRDDVPICEINLTLTPTEREESDYSDRQLCFLQVVYSAHQGAYDPLEYDICWDSMLHLQAYTGIESEAVQTLVDDGLLNIDCDHPHRLYTLTADGRNEIQAAYREGIGYGHGVGDLGESTLHRMMVQIGVELFTREYAENPGSEVTSVVPYYELDDGHRLDVAGLDEAGEIRVVAEAERVNHDVRRAVPEDYDKMASFDPEEAIWIVRNRESAHDVLHALNEPPIGKPRVEKTYSRSSPPSAFRLDAPGCTQIHTLRYVRDSLLEL